MLIFSSHMTLSRQMMATHHRHAFILPEKVQRLRIDFAYAPKHETNIKQLRQEAALIIMKSYGECPLSEDTRQAIEAQLEDLQSGSTLITLSLDGPKGFVGASHRQTDPIQISITEQSATPGYLPCELLQGEWTVWLHMHSICSASVSCSLQVSAEMEAEI